MRAACAEPRLRGTLESTMVVAIITVLIAVAAANFERCIAIARMAEAFMLTSTVRADLVAYRAVHGGWPAREADLANATANQLEGVGQFVEQVALLPHGGIAVHFNDDSGTISGKQLIFHAATARPDGGTPVSWFCRSGGGVSLFVCR
jgi:type II secretory pathway pseudopilin PulG